MLKSESLTYAVAASRARQAHVLPRFAAVEGGLASSLHDVGSVL